MSSANFSSSFVGVQGYNCSGGPINARRIGIGDYEVQFNNGTALALGNVISPNPSTSSLIGSVSIVQLGEGDFQVLVWDPQTQAVEDLPFELMTP